MAGSPIILVLHYLSAVEKGRDRLVRTMLTTWMPASLSLIRCAEVKYVIIVPLSGVPLLPGSVRKTP